MRKKKKGFTLVELSIVLVIIGLVIGGILVGQNMIDLAKINSFTKQIQQYDIAVSNFKQKFKYLPGDSKVFSPPGDQNGIIKNGFGSSLSWGIYSYRMKVLEQGALFSHLSQSGMISEKYSVPLSNSIDTPGVTSPKTKIGLDNTIIYGAYFSDTQEYASNVSPPGHFWTVCYADVVGISSSFCTLNNGNPSYNNGSGLGPLTPETALAVDKKLDDGHPAQGSVIAVGGTGINMSSLSGQECVDNKDTPTVYKTSYTSESCSLRIKMFASTLGGE